MILALDISTSITGYTVIDSFGKIRLCKYVKLSGEKDFVKKVSLACDEICYNLGDYFPAIKLLAVEENLQSFRRGFSSANTINKLARFNGALSFAIADRLKVKLENISVANARKAAGIKLLKSKQTNKTAKEQVLEQVQAILDKQEQQIQWPTKILKSGPRKGQSVIQEGCYDMADSIVIAIAARLQFEKLVALN
jgi:hypothetical protein